jgi:hypothetical protein
MRPSVSAWQGEDVTGWLIVGLVAALSAVAVLAVGLVRARRPRLAAGA